LRAWAAKRTKGGVRGPAALCYRLTATRPSANPLAGVISLPGRLKKAAGHR
jgi:hypothetical protein